MKFPKSVFLLLIRPKKFLCFLLQSGKKMGTGGRILVMFYFIFMTIKTFRVELAAQECGF